LFDPVVLDLHNAGHLPLLLCRMAAYVRQAPEMLVPGILGKLVPGSRTMLISTRPR